MPFITIGQDRIEYEWFHSEGELRPAIVLLHEGLGSVSLWRDFPSRLNRATGHAVLAYSRKGYGRSAPLTKPREVSYLHDEALIVLPQLLNQLQIERPILLGHSDGASIALIYAGTRTRELSAAILLAPRVFVEEVAIRSIAVTKVAYGVGDLRARLARFHNDVDSAFRGWNDIWLHPEFRSWNIESYLAAISCPLLMVQGEEDEYGTMEQVDRIAHALPQARVLKLTSCGHAPQRDQPQVLLGAIVEFVRQRGERDT